MFELIFFQLVLGQIKGIIPQAEIKVRIQTYQEDTYYLLAKDQPAEITVEGPTWIRVYTRIPWHEDWTGTKTYKIIQQTNGQQEKFISLESERSKVAKAGPIRLSKWRSFFINVPKGRNTYRFVHWASPTDSIFLKYAFETPGKWSDQSPSSYVSKLELTEDEKIIEYYEATDQKPVTLEVTGPRKIKIIARLNFTMTMPADQYFTIDLKEKGRSVKTKSFRAYRSETTVYRNLREAVPSNPQVFYFDVRKGTHRYELFLAGQVGSIALRIQAEQK
jgi:hypothetical protein